jgi:hypothetical protein
VAVVLRSVVVIVWSAKLPYGGLGVLKMKIGRKLFAFFLFDY